MRDVTSGGADRTPEAPKLVFEPSQNQPVGELFFDLEGWITTELYDFFLPNGMVSNLFLTCHIG